MDETSLATPCVRRLKDDSGYLTTSPSPIIWDSAECSKRPAVILRKRELEDTPLLYNRKLPKSASGNERYAFSKGDTSEQELSDSFLTVQTQLPESTPIREKASTSRDISECSSILGSFSELQVGSKIPVRHCVSKIVPTNELSEHCNSIESKVKCDDYEESENRSCAAFLAVEQPREVKLLSSRESKGYKKEDNAMGHQSCVLKRRRSVLSVEHFKSPRRSFIGLPFVDFPVELCEAGSYGLIFSKVLSYLDPEDIIRMSLVSRAWNKICASDKKTNSRRLAYIERVRSSKENLDWFCVKPDTSQTPTFRTGPFREIQNINNNSNNGSKKRPFPPQRSPPVSPTKIRFKMFVKAGGAVESGGRLVPCPRCRRPSHIKAYSTSAQCSLESCKYTFCILCFCDCHDGQPCSATRRPTPKQRPCTIGSAESKRNLRRL